jgi:hypothetical protein
MVGPSSATEITPPEKPTKGQAARMVAERLLLPADAERAADLAAQDRLSQLH